MRALLPAPAAVSPALAPTAGIIRHARKSHGSDSAGAGTDPIGSLTVDNGELILPGGMRCELLVMQEEASMTPAMAGRLLELVKQGARVLGSKPLRSPSLSPASMDLPPWICLHGIVWRDCLDQCGGTP